MKKIIGSSPSFSGEFHLLYDAEGCLVKIDFTAASMTPQQRNFIKVKAPTIYDSATFLACFENAKIEFIDEGYEIAFEMFWNSYARKINPDRCRTLWNRLTKAEQAKAFYGILHYNNHLKANPWKNKADPETYLKKEYWNNEWKHI